MTAADVADELLELWHRLDDDERVEILEALPNDEAQALELALGPDPDAVAAARIETADPVAWVRTWLPSLMPLDPGPHHDTLLGALEDDGPVGRRLVAGAPRGSGKSTTALTALPLVAAVRRSHRFVVIIRDNLPDAVSSVRGIRTLLESSPDLVKAYPWLRPLPGEQGELHLAGGVIILARSTGSAIRGLNRILPDGSIARPDLVIGDDLEDDESARSTLQTGRLEEWLLGTIGQLGGPPGREAAPLDLVVIGTTLEVNALVSRMLAGVGPFAAWHRHRFPAEGTVAELDGTRAVVDAEGEATSIPLPDDAEVGDRIPLWAPGMPLAYLDRLSDPADELYVGSILYSREYLLRPRQRTDVLFASARTVWAPVRDRWLSGELTLERQGMGVDPAVSVREVADWTAVVVTALARAGDVLDDDELERLGLVADRTCLVVPYVERRRGTPGEILDWIEEAAGLWIPSGRVAFEAEGGFAAMADELRRRRKASVRPVKAGGQDKRTRAVPLSVWQEASRLIIDESLRSTAFDLELHGFTGTGQEEHDDEVDALVYAATYSTNAWRRR
jgi:hypothetical protein